jgi:O-antigen ligase
MTLRLRNIEHHRVLTDGLAAAMVASLPWSTSATGILVVAWLLALLPLLRAQDVREVMRRPAAWLPAVLVLFMAAGMLWAFDATWSERLRAFNASAKLLVIPLLMIQFARKDGGTAERGGVWALNAFIASCTLLLFFSAGSFLWPRFPLWSWVKMPGLPVKDYIIQSGLFVLCAFILLYLARDALQRRRYPVFALRAALAAAFLADVFFVTSGRTSLVTVPVLLLLYALVCFRWKAASAIMVSGMLVGGAVWSSSDYVRMRLGTLVHEVQDYRAAEKRSSAGERLEFWKKSVGFVREAPVLGHGTGSIRALFARAATGSGDDVSAIVSNNPHNQFLTVAVQIGVLGGLVTIAMWIAHLLLFRGGGLVAWIGLLVVVQNIVGSLFNSHLFDFGQGWLYAFGVGIAGGLMLRPRSRAQTAQAQAAALARA